MNRRMKIAKADKQDLDELSNYLKKNEDKNMRSSKTFPWGWRRVIWGCDILIENVCDPTVDHLELHPGYEFSHVAPEQ